MDLQDIELQIVDIRRQIGRLERRLTAQTRKVEQMRQALAAEREEVRRDQARFDTLDVDLKARQQNIERLRAHLNTVRTNKEYAAVLAQLNNEKADASRLENQAMELMQAVEQKKQELAAREQEQEAEARKCEQYEADLRQARASFAGRLGELESRRRQAMQTLDAQVVSLFERLSQRYDGEVMAEVQQPNPRQDEYVCGGCYMALRPDVANALKVRDEIQTCKNCGRILYLAS